MYSVYFKNDFAQPPACRGFSAYASESDSILRNSLFDSAESLDPEFFSPVLTTEGLFAGCGSLFNPGHPSDLSNDQKPCHFGVVS
jgi:hypothetical protein